MFRALLCPSSGARIWEIFVKWLQYYDRPWNLCRAGLWNNFSPLAELPESDFRTRTKKKRIPYRTDVYSNLSTRNCILYLLQNILRLLFI